MSKIHPSPEVRADANDRATRTITQGVKANIVGAVVLVALSAAANTDRLSGVNWGDMVDVVGYALFVALLTAALSWTQRVREP